MPLLSIIVPVYNKEKYIDDTVKSILAQSVKDFELILVNDGSTDGSLEKCKKYQDPRITLIDKPNGGVSSARNAGLEQATGKFIGFIDSDDTIDADMYEMLINNAINHDADISVCRMRVIFPTKTVNENEDNAVTCLEHDEALAACLQGKLDRSANNKIYRSSIAQSVNFEGNIYEDILYTCKVFLAAKKTVVQNAIKYNYIVRDNSASMSKFNPKYVETIDVANKIVELVGERSKSNLPYAQSFDVLANISLLNLLLLSDKDTFSAEYAKVIGTLNKYKAFISSSALVRRKHKAAYKLFSLSPVLYSFAMKIYCKIIDSEVVKRT